MTHGNVLATISAVMTIVPGLGSNDVYLAYLPLAHILELAAEVWITEYLYNLLLQIWHSVSYKYLYTYALVLCFAEPNSCYWKSNWIWVYTYTYRHIKQNKEGHKGRCLCIGTNTDGSCSSNSRSCSRWRA